MSPSSDDKWIWSQTSVIHYFLLLTINNLLSVPVKIYKNIWIINYFLLLIKYKSTTCNQRKVISDFSVQKFLLPGHLKRTLRTKSDKYWNKISKTLHLQYLYPSPSPLLTMNIYQGGGGHNTLDGVLSMFFPPDLLNNK